MAYTSIYNGIVFIEGNEPSAKIIKHIEYQKTYTINAQLKSLDCVKEQLAEKTTALGGNAVVNFKYGQKDIGWFRSILLPFDDDIKWHGDGCAAVIPDERLNEILEQLKK